MPKRLFLLLFLLILALAAPVAAQDEEPPPANGINMEVKAGFDGFYKNAYAVPVLITIANTGPDIEGELRVEIKQGGLNSELLYNAPIALPTQSNKRVSLYVHIPNILRELTVELYDEDNRLVASKTSNILQQMAADELLYGVVSPSPGEFSFLETLTGGRADAKTAFLALEELPTVPPAWNGLDVLIVDDVDTAVLSTAQLDALNGWVETGGQLVVTGGPGWQKTAVALNDYLPVNVNGSKSVEDLPALAESGGFPLRDPGPYVVADSSLRGGGELIYHQNGLPLLARRDYGRGAVYYVALDPKLAPLLDWDGAETFWGALVNRIPEPSAWAEGIVNEYTAVNAVSTLPSLALPSTLPLVLFLTIYIIVIGPANYFVLKRRNQLAMGWVTIPVISLLFAFATYLVGFQIKGNKNILNQISIAQGQIGGETMRVESPIGLYSPRRAAYAIRLPYENLARPLTPNSTSGGVNVEAISRNAELTLNGVRVDVGGIETFTVDSYQPMPAIGGQATLDLEGSDIQLNAVLENNSDTAFENVVLLLGSTTYKVGDMEPQTNKIISENVGTVSSSGNFVPYSTSSNSPLLDNADHILGTSDYYSDSEVRVRWELLQALETNASFGPAASTVSWSADTLTLIAWSDESQIDVQIDSTPFDSKSTTLYLLDVPLTQNLIASGDGQLTELLLNWEIVDYSSNIYEPSIENFYMDDGWLEIEYQPWLQFRETAVESMSIRLTKENIATTYAPPTVYLWNWTSGEWVEAEDGGWGETAVANPAPYLGPGNAVHLRLEKAANTPNIRIRSVTPILLGITE